MEPAVVERPIERNRTCVLDRGCANFALFNRIVDSGSTDVCRVRHNSIYEVVDSRPLTVVDRDARVLSDEIISPGGGSSKKTELHSSAGCD